MSFQAKLLQRLLDAQRVRGLSETAMATELGMSSARWGNYKSRKEVAKDGIEAAITWLEQNEPSSPGQPAANPYVDLSSEALRLITGIAALDRSQRGLTTSALWKDLAGIVTKFAALPVPADQNVPTLSADQLDLHRRAVAAAARDDAAEMVAVDAERSRRNQKKNPKSTRKRAND